MNLNNTISLLSTQSGAASVTTPGFFLNNIRAYGITVEFSGADLAGTLKLQGSAKGTNWFDITGSSQSVTLATGHMWDVTACGYKWVRVVWTYSSGTGNITIDLDLKENVVQFA